MSEIKNGWYRLSLYRAEHSKCNHTAKLGFRRLWHPVTSCFDLLTLKRYLELRANCVPNLIFFIFSMFEFYDSSCDGLKYSFALFYFVELCLIYKSNCFSRWLYYAYNSGHVVRSSSTVRVLSALYVPIRPSPGDRTRPPQRPCSEWALSTSTACYHIAWACLPFGVSTQCFYLDASSDVAMPTRHQPHQLM